MKRKILASILATSFALGGLTNASASELQTPQVQFSSWAVSELVEAENYGIFPQDWYYSDFMTDITTERLSELLKNINAKFDALDLVQKEDFAETEVNLGLTRGEIVNSLYQTVEEFEDISDLDSLTYFTENGILLGDGSDLRLYDNATTEEAVILATRFIDTVFEQTEEGSKGFAWVVENEGNKVYLLGSIHIGDSSLYPVNDMLLDAFYESDALVVEANIFSTEGLDEFNKIANYQDGQTLKDNISEELYNKVSQTATILGIPMTLLDNMKPWSVANNLSAIYTVYSTIDEENSVSSAAGIDMYFLSKNLFAQKPVFELEGTLYQANLFDSLSEEFQEQNLEATVTSIINQEKTDTDALAIWLDYYENGDIEAFEESIVSSFDTDNELTNMLVGVRDINMAEKIAELLTSEGENTYFVIAGGAHFTVENSVIDHLEEDGFTVSKFYE